MTEKFALTPIRTRNREEHMPLSTILVLRLFSPFSSIHLSAILKTLIFQCMIFYVL